MAGEAGAGKQTRALGSFDRYLTLWVLLCIVAGIVLGRLAPGTAKLLDGLSIYSGGAPVVSIPIAVCHFFMMFPASSDTPSRPQKRVDTNPARSGLARAGPPVPLTTGSSPRPSGTGPACAAPALPSRDRSAPPRRSPG